MRANPSALTALRERTGLSQNQLAAAAGVSAGTVSRIEAGESDGRPSTLKSLADALEVPVTAITVAATEAVA